MAENVRANDAWLGEIPPSWSLKKINALYILRNQKVSDIDYPPLSVTKQGVLPQLETAAKTNDHNNRKLVKKGDFAINSRSDRRGSCGISEYDGSVSLINTVIKPLNVVDNRYYSWLFHTDQFADEFYKWGHGIVDDLWTTTWDDMKNINLPVPSLTEQSRIADFLDSKCAEIDFLSADIQKQIDTLEEYKRSVITEAVTKGLDPDVEIKESGIAWIGQIAAGRELSRIKFFYQITLGKMVDSKQYSDDEMDHYLCAANIKWNGVNTSVERLMRFSASEKAQYLLEIGDVLVMEGGATAGITCVYDDEFAPCYIQNSVLRCRGIKGNSNKYLYYWMYFAYFSGYRDMICNGATFYHYTKEKVAATPIVMPSIGEQHCIVAYLDSKCAEIDAAIDLKKKQLTTLDGYKKSLIYEYVTGKKEVPNE